MRVWHFWWRNLVYSAQHNPPQFVEVVMLAVAVVLLGLWSFSNSWACLVLCLSYAAGSSMAMLVRETIAPSPQAHPTQAVAVLLLLISLFTLAEVVL